MPVHTDFFQRLTIEGGGLEKQNIGTERLILGANMSLSVDQASELSFDLNDPNWAYISSFTGERGPIGKKAIYGTDMPLYVSSFSLAGGPAGNGGTQLKFQPAGIGRARQVKNALTRNNISPTQYAKDAAANFGMKFVGQDSPKRPSITRDVSSTTDKSSDSNEWSTLNRLANEEGYLVFESLNTLYFASPQWLFDKRPTNTVGYGLTVSDDALRLMDLPSIEMSTSAKTDDEITFDLPIKSAGRILPGTNVIVKGVFKGMADKKLLVTSVAYPLAGLGNVSITAKYPWKIEKQAQAGANDGTGTSKGGATLGNLAGNTAGERAVNAARAKVGTPYAWGGGGLNGPTKGIRDGGVADSYGDYNKVGFDCSGLTRYAWYQGSGGKKTLGRTTYDQRNAGPRVSMGALIPGDLILMSNDGHIAIYAGGGKMVEAPQSGDVVKVSNTRGGYGVRVT